jgi:hypothetical protein
VIAMAGPGAGCVPEAERVRAGVGIEFVDAAAPAAGFWVEAAGAISNSILLGAFLARATSSFFHV